MTEKSNSFVKTLTVGKETYSYYPVSCLPGAANLPYSLKVLVENVLRNSDDWARAEKQARCIINAGCAGEAGDEIEFCPARVLFQDFTGVPVFVDFAAMREACLDLGGDPSCINPQIPCDLVIDHSVIADVAGCSSALKENEKFEFSRNSERYNFLKWAQQSFEKVRIVPPGAGICHQLNIEHFAQGVMTDSEAATIKGLEYPLAYFDTVVGTDSHTPTVNGIGVLGWGVGGIEAEAAALGQAITTLVPQVIGVRLTGRLSQGVSAMDAALSFAQMLRKKGVVGAFVECYGPGLRNLSATQRTCISNMTPEYGSTVTLFPVDEKTLEYYRVTGRNEKQIALIAAYAKAQGLWHRSEEERTYSEVIEVDLGEVERSLAGPSRPHDRFAFAQAHTRFQQICEERGLATRKSADVCFGDRSYKLYDGALAIAAVTSCTTASDAHMMLTCGLLAKNAVAAGLRPQPWVKCIFAPGSKATQLLLERAGLLDSLEALGFYTCGFGCMSCIGNSGPILKQMHEVAESIELASILSGNRNFEGRISPDVAQNYLAAPALVVAYALIGSMEGDLQSDPLGYSPEGSPVYLEDIWPESTTVDALASQHLNASLYRDSSRGLYEGDTKWRQLSPQKGATFCWSENSSYVRRAPYFDSMSRKPEKLQPLSDARALAVLGDFITTDHISPAGSLQPESPAAHYLESYGVAPSEFNTYGSRRGNHEVMMRGTFANVKLKNQLANGRLGGWTFDFLSSKVRRIFDAAQAYGEAGVPLVVLAGKMYGSGSSRDWAAKGPLLLGVRAVFAESFERIHRSNLIGMGILPLQFESGQNSAALGLDGSELFSLAPVDFSQGLPRPAVVAVSARKSDGSCVHFNARIRIDTATEGSYFIHGGILPYVLRGLLAER